MSSERRNELLELSEIEEMTKAYILGHTIEEIASSFDFTKEEVISKLSKGLKEFKTKRMRGDRLKKDDRRIIEFFHNQGYSNYFLANLLDCSKTTIANELKRSNVVERSDPYSSQIAQDDYNLKNYIELGQKKINRRKNNE